MFLAGMLAVALLSGCNERTPVRRTLNKIGMEKFRSETLNVCREGFAAGRVQKVFEDRWPDPVRTLKPMGMWAEPDGAYVLLDSDADSERGIYLPRIVSDKDPVCGPKLTHEKLGRGVYWYIRKR